MTEDDLRDLERRRLVAVTGFDAAISDELHADDFQLINPLGAALSKSDYLGGLASGFLNYLVFEPASDIAVFLSPGSGVLRYLSNLEISVDDGASSLTNCWHTDYYEERDGRWQIVWSHATRVE